MGAISARAQAPVADFTASVVSGCGPLSVSFTDKSTNSPTSWTWDFGNGQISNAKNPTIIFTTAGTFTITLIAKNGSGSGSARKTNLITVFASPTPNFTSNITVGCAPATVQFTDQTTPGQGTITSWAWEFTGGNPSNVQNPVHVFNNTGYYTISLTATNSGGCTNKITRGQYMRVVPGVQAAFTYAQTSAGCSAPFSITFNNQTSGPGTMSYAWDLNNGTTSNVTNPSTTYPTNNPYTISLIANSSLGCSDTVTNTINFQAGTGAITAPDQACINTAINFQNSSTPAPLSSSWDFGDGTTAAVANPTKSYAAAGTYTVTLTNSYASCTAPITKTITIVNTPTASFSADKQAACVAPLTVNFTDLTTTDNSWLWNFGDGTTAAVAAPSHTYTAPGNYTVSLSTNTGTGCSAVDTQVNFIQIGAPTMALHGGTVQGCVGAVLKPTADINAPDGVANYLWSSPDATSSTGTNTAAPTFTYSTQGYHDITLTITTNGGCTATQTFKNGVLVGTPITPVTFAASTTTPCADHVVTFTSPSTSAATQWVWNFGDTTIISKTAPPIDHTYKSLGYKTVTLTVYHSGCTTSGKVSNFLQVNGPLAGFKYQINCANRTQVSFTDTSLLGGITPTYLWDFGDSGPTSNAANPVHTFPSIGPYTVTETVTGPLCSDTRTTHIDLTPVVPSFTSPANICENTAFTVTSTSAPVAEIEYYSWKLDANAPLPDSTQGSRSITVPTPGNHTISLTITDSGGCTYTPVVNPIVINGPVAKFTAGAGGCRNSTITFTDASVPDPSSPIQTWTLDPGDGTTPVTVTPPSFTHVYADTGTFRPILTVTDSKGCTNIDTSATTLKISSARAGFFAADTLYCPGVSLPFTDSSQGKGLTYSWDFGDGSALSGTRNHVYTGDGQYYSVKLKVTDATGCSDSVTRTNYIHIQSPIGSFTMTDSVGICLPMQTSFFPTAQYYKTLSWDFGDGSNSTLDTTTHFYQNYGTYTAKLNLKGAGGCTTTASRKVYLYNPYSYTKLTYGPTSGCDSFLVTFHVTAPPFTRSILTFGDGAADSTENTTITHEYSFPSTYGAQLAINDSSGCFVYISGATKIKVLGAVPFFNLSAKKFCDTGMVQFTDVTITNDNPVAMLWDFGDGSTATGTVGDPATENPVHNYTTPGLHTPTLTLHTSSGCVESYSDTVHVYQTPHPVITLPTPSCVNTPLQLLGSLAIPDLVDTISWSWNLGNGQTSTNQNVNVSYPTAGQYTVSLHTSVSYGCNDTTSQQLTVNPQPEIKGPAVITTPVGTPVTIPFTYSADASTWSWTPVYNLSCADCPNPVATLTFGTEFYVKVTDANSCVNTDSILIKTICNGENYFIPNTFSPNNDGVNDVFYPRGTSAYNIQSIQIFNRWGQKVFERKDFPANVASQGWDGTFNGRPAPADTYVYIAQVICENAETVALKGDVTLIR